jgi:hypothetical protein
MRIERDPHSSARAFAAGVDFRVPPVAAGIRMQSLDQAEIVARLHQLKLEHRDLDVAIERLSVDIGMDELQLRRLKKRKLLIKDSIARLESRLIPDLDA